MAPAYRLGLIADDVTGASDSAVQFARRGWHALLALDVAQQGLTPVPIRGSDPNVVAVTTNARALDNATAETLTADALSKLIEAGVDHIYLKIDSTMRGSVPGQIAGALAAWRTKHPNASAVVCPAYPRMGRAVIANRLLVNGQPVDESPIGRDPVTPVRTSDMAVLLPGSSRGVAGRIVKNAPPVATVDADSDEALGHVALAIAAAGPSVIPVGSGGLAQAMANVWSSDDSIHAAGPRLRIRQSSAGNPRILILVTSLNPVSQAQAARLANAFPDVGVLLAPVARVGNQSVAEQLSADFAERVASDNWDVLGFVGGDGARAALGRLGASAIQIIDSIVEGIPLGVIVGGLADGMPVFTKAGGFGAEDALVRVVEHLRHA